MNLDQPCRRCGRPRREHKGGTHQGACPQDSDFMRMEALRSHLPIPYKDRIWQGGMTGLPGCGPWAIDPQCPSGGHNTRTAADKPARWRCICPRAQAIMTKRRKQRADFREAWGKRQPEEEPPDVIARAVTIPQPDLSAGHCTSPVGQDIAAAAFDSRSGYRAAVEMCKGCPVSLKCLQYAMEAERPRGAWGGVWGGLTPEERKRAFS